ncbi:MAG: radical SAM peptide maturase [Bacteroidales bacterium]|jgi:uncharacterized protein|nr:radical SAM peptide maturase [Bacteroidales bacterium]
MIQRKAITKGQIISSLINTPQITFEITDKCNLKCEYCSYGQLYSDYDSRENKDLDIDKAIRFLDYFVELWDLSSSNSINNSVYISFYGGEPLLNFSFIETVVNYINKIKDSKRKFIYSMTTNGILLDKYIDILVANDFSLLISLDGNEYCNSYRINKLGKNSFTHVVENINKLKSKYPNYFANKVNFNTVLHNRNSVAEIYNFFHQTYDKVPSIGSLNDMGIRDDMKIKFIQMFQNVTESLMQSENYGELENQMFLLSPTYHSATVFLMQNSPYKYENYNELLFGKYKNEKIMPSGTCIPFSKKVFITVNGKILPCERIGHQFALGTIEKDYINLDFEEITQKYNVYYSKISPLCNKCYNAKTCIQCIFNIPEIEKSKCNCKGFMNNEMYETYKNLQLSFFARHPEAYNKIMSEVIYK